MPIFCKRKSKGSLLDTKAWHLLVDVVLSREIREADVLHIKNCIAKNLTVVDKIEHKFHPQGETIVFILSESHFTLHTYPELNYMSLDLYVCNLDVDVKKIIKECLSAFPVLRIEEKKVVRGKIGVVEDELRLKIVYALAVIVAASSILYELFLAQTISTTMGNTALRYNTTIGIYIAAMGLGALMYRKIIRGNIFHEFIKLEIILSTIGGTASVLILVFDSMAKLLANKLALEYFSLPIQSLIFIFNHLMIVTIGFLSGLELPLLMDMGKNFNKLRSNTVLAFDYLGTLLGAVFFPIAILPTMHLFTIGYLISFFNVLVAIVANAKFESGVDKKHFQKVLFVLVLLWGAVFLFSSSINNFVVERFYFSN